MNKDSKRTCGKQKRMKWDRYSRQGKIAKGSEEKNEKKKLKAGVLINT